MESIMAPIFPPVVPFPQAPADVNNSESNHSVINEEKPKEPETSVIKNLLFNSSIIICLQ